MNIVNSNNSNLNDQRGGSVMNWLRFFQEERDIWVQNVSATQLSLQFEVAQGTIQGVLIPMGADPMCLTQEVPFDAIKKSMDFRRFLNRSPTIMKVMTEDDVQSYYRKKAEDMRVFTPDGQPDVQAALAKADEERRQSKTMAPGDVSTFTDASGQVTFTPPKSAQELMGLNQPQHMGPGPQQAGGFVNPGSNGGIPQGFVNGPGHQVNASGPVMVDQLINPRVVNLCQQVSSQVAPNMRMPADQLFRELKPLEASMSLDDIQYVQAHGSYATVKKWASALLDQRAAAEEVPG